MRVVGIIQARLGSRRLPAKVLETIQGRAAIRWTISRASQALSFTDLICAVPEGVEDLKLQAEVKKSEAELIVGSPNDVLSRFVRALDSLETEPDYVVRMTGDCPLIDPKLIDRLVTAATDADADYGYISGFPHGLDCEIIKSSTLRWQDAHNQTPEAREHVTFGLAQSSATQSPSRVLKLALADPPTDVATFVRWVLDYPQDLDALRLLFEHLGEAALTASWQDIADVYIRHPDILSITRGVAADWKAAQLQLQRGHLKNQSGHDPEGDPSALRPIVRLATDQEISMHHRLMLLCTANKATE